MKRKKAKTNQWQINSQAKNCHFLQEYFVVARSQTAKKGTVNASKQACHALIIVDVKIVVIRIVPLYNMTSRRRRTIN